MSVYDTNKTQHPEVKQEAAADDWPPAESEVQNFESFCFVTFV